jgi:hypothetical protein
MKSLLFLYHRIRKTNVFNSLTHVQTQFDMKRSRAFDGVSVDIYFGEE